VFFLVFADSVIIGLYILNSHPANLHFFFLFSGAFLLLFLSGYGQTYITKQKIGRKLNKKKSILMESAETANATLIFVNFQISQKIGDLPRMMERPQSKDGFGGAGKTARK
jgi:hypothetical protein